MSEHDIKAHKLLSAFEDKTFQEHINQYRYEIEIELKAFLDWLISELTPNQPIFRSPESRIKSKQSFEEKIYRKDYINKWDLNGKQEDIQREIMQKLPDLIGFRITCFFMDDEEKIYKKINQYYSDHRFNNIKLDFLEGTQQKNGKKIYKVSGKYIKDVSVSFEIQIKAATHNVWGEVEHRTIYKGKQYHIAEQNQQRITDEVYNILYSSDQQLLSLFTSKYSQEDLICALFAEQTREKVSKKVNTEFLADHYACFFSIFHATLKKQIREYVSASLSGNNDSYTKSSPDSNLPNKDENELIERIKNSFVEYYLVVQFVIAQELYDFKNYDDFILFMIRVLKPRIDDLDEENVENDAFSDDEEGATQYDSNEMIISVLSKKLPDALKERE